MLFAGTGIQDSWQEPEYCVQKGQPVFRKNSPHADPFTAMSANPEMARNFDQAMAIFAPMTAAAVADAYDLSRLGTVADIGAARFKLARIVPTLARVAVIEGVRAPIEETKSGHPGDVHLAGSRSALKKLYRAIHEERTEIHFSYLPPELRGRRIATLKLETQYQGQAIATSGGVRARSERKRLRSVHIQGGRDEE